MPRIVNAYEGNSVIGDSLARLGEAIYGDQAQKEVSRQKAFGLKRENDNAEPLAAAVRDGNKNNIGYYGVMAGKTGQDAGDYNRLSSANHATSFDDPRLAISMMGAGGAAGSTAVGQRRALDNAVTTTGMNNATTLEAQRIQSDRAHQTQMDIDSRTLTPVDDGNGGYHYELKSNAVGQGAPMSTDQVKASVISQALRNRANLMQPNVFPVNGADPWAATGVPATPVSPVAPSSFVPGGANSAPPYPYPNPGGTHGRANAQQTGDIFANLTPQMRALIGVNNEQPMVDPRSGQTGISRDYGTTLENGQPATGYMPTTQEGALKQERDNNTRTFAGQPLPPSPTGYSQYASDAGKAAGLKSVVQGAANDVAGLFGVGEINPSYNRARENLTNTAQSVRQLMESAPGVRAAVAREKMADKTLPQPNFLGMTGMNADEQKNRAVSTTQHLRDLYGMVQQDAMDANTPPEERAKMVSWMHNMSHAIQQMEAPVAGTQPAQAAAAPPQQQPAAAMPTNPRGHGPLFQQAREAIDRGANPEHIKRRLQQMGLDPTRL
jgi:hypothetical protein